MCRLRRWKRGVEVDYGLDLGDENTAGRENAAVSCCELRQAGAASGQTSSGVCVDWGIHFWEGHKQKEGKMSRSDGWVRSLMGVQNLSVGRPLLERSYECEQAGDSKGHSEDPLLLRRRSGACKA